MLLIYFILPSYPLFLSILPNIDFKFIETHNIDLTLRPENLPEGLFYKITEYYEKKITK